MKRCDLKFGQRVRFIGKDATRLTGNPALRPTRTGDTGRLVGTTQFLLFVICQVEMDSGVILSCEPSDLEPFVPSGAAPSTFETLHDLMRHVRAMAGTQ